MKALLVALVAALMLSTASQAAEAPTLEGVQKLTVELAFRDVVTAQLQLQLAAERYGRLLDSLAQPGWKVDPETRQFVPVQKESSK